MNFKAGSHPYTVVGVPEKNSGTRIVPIEELVELLKNPKLQEAVDRIEKHDFEGKPSGIKQVLRKQIKDDIATRLRVKSNKMVIDYQLKKHEGKI